MSETGADGTDNDGKRVVNDQPAVRDQWGFLYAVVRGGALDPWLDVRAATSRWKKRRQRAAKSYVFERSSPAKKPTPPPTCAAAIAGCGGSLLRAAVGIGFAAAAEPCRFDGRRRSLRGADAFDGGHRLP